MKKITFLLGALLIAGLVNAQTPTTPGTANAQSSDAAKVVEFSELDHDFGKIPQGKPVEYDIVLKNISNSPVKIENVQAGCGCTTPKWKRDTYAPGETFKVTLGFNAASPGAFTKNATIFFNNGLSKVVKFHGETIPEAAPATSKN